MREYDLAAVAQLELPKVGQLGYVVENIEASLPEYSSLYKLGTWYRPNYAEKVLSQQGTQLALDIDLVVAYDGDLQIELLQPTGAGNHLYQQHLAQERDDLHHLGFFVGGLEQRKRIATDLGFPVLLEGMFRTRGAGLVRFAYLDTQEQCGTVVELIEIKLFGFRVPQSEFMLNLARLTGDVTRFRRSFDGS